MTALFCVQLFSEVDRGREEFMERINTVIHDLKNMGFEETCIRAAIASEKSLDVQTLVEMLVSGGIVIMK